MEFIGRKKWIEDFNNYKNQENSTKWEITGTYGLGKSTLIKKFRSISYGEKQQHIFLDMDNYVPQTGLEVLKDMAKSAQYFNTEESNKSIKEKSAEWFKKHKENIDGLADTLSVFDPTGGLLSTGTKGFLKYIGGWADDASLISENGFGLNPELFLLKAIAVMGKKKAILFIDTYEHIYINNITIKSNLLFGDATPIETTQRDIKLSEWFKKLFDYLEKSGWKIVVTGRNLTKVSSENELNKFDREEIIEFITKNDKLNNIYQDNDKQESMISILQTLSFGGNPLWLLIAGNLLEKLIEDGEDLKSLASSHETLHNCFEEEDIFDYNDEDGIEYSKCKLSLLTAFTKELNGLEGEAWKLAIPRYFDTDIIMVIFNKELSSKIINHFNKTGLLKTKTKNRYTLHEEIRDLMRFYAKSKSLWESEETREIHRKLYHYHIDTNFTKLPVDLKETLINNTYSYKEPKVTEFQNEIKKYTQELDWMVESVYHNIFSYSIIGAYQPLEFFKSLIGSFSLSIAENYKVSEAIPTLSDWQINELCKTFDKDFEGLKDRFGEETAIALKKAQEAGIHDAIKNIDFWEQRVKNHGLWGDYKGYAFALEENDRREDAIKAYDALIEQFKDVKLDGVQEQVAKVMFNKAIEVGKAYGSEEEINAYDELIVQFKDVKLDGVQERVATAMFNKAIRVGKVYGSEEEINAYDELIEQFKDVKLDGVQEQVANAMQNKYEGLIINNKALSKEENEWIESANLKLEDKASFGLLTIIDKARESRQDDEIARWQKEYKEIKSKTWSFEELKAWIANSSYNEKVKNRINGYIDTFEKHLHRD